jgi:N4-gp56 family major capsid protein
MANETTFSTLAPGGGATVGTDDAVRYIRDELLSIAEKNTVFAQHAMKVMLPQHNSKTIQFSRYPRLALPQTPATEGSTPASQQLSVETVSAVVDQWIMIVTLTDLSVLTIKHPLVPIVTERLGIAKAELVDREIQKVLLASDSVMFAGTGNTSRAGLATTDVLDTAGIRKVWKTLRRNGARATSGGNYMAIVDPEVSQDISDDDKFHSAHELKDVSALYNNEIGEWLGFRVMVSNFIPTHALIADADWTSATAATGSWAGSTISLYVKITRVESDFGFETDISNAENVDVENNEKVNITFPASPASGVTYNVYASDTDNTSTDANLRLISTGNAPGTTLDITTIITDLPEAADFPTTAPASPATGVTVHTSYCFGKETYAMVDLSGDNLRVLVTPSGPSKSDPADQRRPLSLKGSFKAVLLNEDYLRRVESASNFD